MALFKKSGFEKQDKKENPLSSEKSGKFAMKKNDKKGSYRLYCRKGIHRITLKVKINFVFHQKKEYRRTLKLIEFQ